MLKFNKTTFELMVDISEEQKKTAINDFASMNERMVKMIAYLESKDTPQSEKDKYLPLLMNVVHSVSQAGNLLKAMGVPEQEIRALCKI